MVGQLACQVLGAHQVQPVSRAHSGPQLLRVWSLQVGEYQGGVQGIQGKGTRWEERVWGRLCSRSEVCWGVGRGAAGSGGASEGWGFPRKHLPDSSPMLGPRLVGPLSPGEPLMRAHHPLSPEELPTGSPPSPFFGVPHQLRPTPFSSPLRRRSSQSQDPPPLCDLPSAPPLPPPKNRSSLGPGTLPVPTSSCTSCGLTTKSRSLSPRDVATPRASGCRPMASAKRAEAVLGRDRGRGQEQPEAGWRPCLGGWEVPLPVSGLDSWAGALNAQVHVPTHLHPGKHTQRG